MSDLEFDFSIYDEESDDEDEAEPDLGVREPVVPSGGKPGDGIALPFEKVEEGLYVSCV